MTTIKHKVPLSSLEFRIVPAIDILNGQVVRLTKGDYGVVDYFNVDAHNLAQKFEFEGASRLHIVDLDGAKSGSLVNLDTLKHVRKSVSCEIQVGGGIRTLASCDQLFAIGINYIILGSILVKNPVLSKTIIQKYPNRIIAGIDLKNNKIATDGWVQTPGAESGVSQLISELNQLPIAGIISTDIDKDGMMSGPGLDSIQQLLSISNHPIIVSGGVSNLSDIAAIKKLVPMGVNGCIIGKAILKGAISLSEAIAYEKQIDLPYSH